MLEKFLRVIDIISFTMFLVLMASVNDNSDLKVVAILLIFPAVWIVARNCIWYREDD